MSQIPPHIFITFDACGFVPPDPSEKQAVRELLTLIDQYKIQCDIPEDAAGEMDRHQGARRKRLRWLVSCNTQMERQQFLELKKILFGTKATLAPNESNDIRILLNAEHYFCSYFVTFDKKHILRKRDKIRSKLGFEVVTPSQCLAILREYLRKIRVSV